MVRDANILPHGVEKLDIERRAHVELLAAELKRENFESDEAFREALVEQYRALRTDEYETEVRRQTLEMYTASRGRGGRINHDIWVGALDNSAPADSCAVTAYQRYPQMNPHGGRIASCAKTAVSVIGQVSDNLGYTGYDNIATRTSKDASLASARGVHDGLGNKEYRKTGVLKDLITQGEIGSGSIVSVPVGNNGGSGYHAMVLADVVRDGKDNVVGYYLQGNNRTSYKYYDINSKDKWNNASVICTATNVWMNDRIDDEVNGKSPEELQAMIAATKDRMLGQDGKLDKLTTIEQEMVSVRGRSETDFEVNCGMEAGCLQHKNMRMFIKMNPIAAGKIDLTSVLEVPQIDDNLMPTFVSEPDVLMGAKAPSAKKENSKAPEAPVVEPKAPEGEAPTPEVKAPEAEPETRAAAADERPTAGFTPEEKAFVASMFTRIDEAGWGELTGAYMDSYDKDASVADAMRSDATRTAAADGSTPSLVDGLSAEASANGVTNGERPALAAALSDDKTATDGMFGALMSALTTNDDKDLDSSMKLALDLMTSFLDGANKENTDDVPTLSDFMKYLTDDKEQAPVLDKSDERSAAQPAQVSLRTPGGVPLAMTTFLHGGR